MTDNSRIVVLLGPTASGKTKLAVQLAHILDAEIISADSRQVYRGLDIGSGKDLSEYTVNGKQIPYHLIDVVHPDEEYHIYRYQQDVQAAIQAIQSKGKPVILCGGSGMYIDAVLNGFEYTQVPVNEKLRAELEQKTDEELRALFRTIQLEKYKETADTSSRKKTIRAIEIAFYLKENELKKNTSAVSESIILGITLTQKERWKRIEERLNFRLKNGLIEEVENLMKAGIKPEKLIYFGLEYKYVVMYLQKQLSFEALVEQLNVAIRQFSKRQMTYFRKMERDGKKIHWLDGTASLEVNIKEILSIIK